MLFKIFIVLSIFITSSFAGFEKVRIGRIDNVYQDRVNYQILKEIISEIEYTFESQLGKNIFDFDDVFGKDIDILYVEPTRLEQRINRKVGLLEQKKRELDSIERSFPSKLDEIDKLNLIYSKFNDDYSNNVIKYNKFIEEANSKEITSRQEYERIKEKSIIMKKDLNEELRDLKKVQRELNRKTNSYNNQIISFNNKIRSYNRLNNELESLNRNFKKVKGRAIGQKEINLKTFYENGKRVEEKTIINSMSKIEIYGFENLNELKAVLAHEIGHLVGLPHVEAKGALMNPILQENQLENLVLTIEDIQLFRKYF